MRRMDDIMSDSIGRDYKKNDTPSRAIEDAGVSDKWDEPKYFNYAYEGEEDDLIEEIEYKDEGNNIENYEYEGEGDDCDVGDNGITVIVEPGKNISVFDNIEEEYVEPKDRTIRTLYGSNAGTLFVGKGGVFTDIEEEYLEESNPDYMDEYGIEGEGRVYDDGTFLDEYGRDTRFSKEELDEYGVYEIGNSNYDDYEDEKYYDEDGGYSVDEDDEYRTYEDGGDDYVESKPPRRGLKAFWIMLIIFMLLSGGCFYASYWFQVNGNKVENKRVPATASIGFNYNCIHDNLDWVRNDKMTLNSMEYFYNKTGVQPYLVTYGYIDNTKKELNEFSKDWIANNVHNECYMLIMYISGVDVSQKGNFIYLYGDSVGSVMDPDARQVVSRRMDEKWMNSTPKDSMLQSFFTELADELMYKSIPGSTLSYLWLKCAQFLSVLGAIVCLILLIRGRMRVKID